MAGRHRRHHSKDQLLILVERRAPPPINLRPELLNGDHCLPPLAATCYHRNRYENEKRQECNRLVLAREQKQSVVDTYRTHATDTGSPEVQIALLRERMGKLTEHFKAHKKDKGPRR